MTQQPQEPGQVVGEDPFWSVVRRRHPDVDIVVLPPEAESPQPTPPGAPVEQPAEVAAREDAGVRRLWVRLVGDLGPLEATWQARWVAGGAPERVRREATLAVDGADGQAVLERLAGAAAVLRDDGWHVVVPPQGLPRVMAGREHDEAGAGLGREELQLVLSTETGRLVLRVRCVDHVVGAAVAQQLVGQTAGEA